MDVLVAGGTGFVGRSLCAVLADRGHAVTPPSQSPALVACRLIGSGGVTAPAGDPGRRRRATPEPSCPRSRHTPV